MAGARLRDAINLTARRGFKKNRPSPGGDTIKVGDIQGRVVRMRTRATELERADGKRVFVPNVYLAQNPVQRLDRGRKPA